MAQSGKPRCAPVAQTQRSSAEYRRCTDGSQPGKAITQVPREQHLKQPPAQAVANARSSPPKSPLLEKAEHVAPAGQQTSQSAYLAFFGTGSPSGVRGGKNNSVTVRAISVGGPKVVDLDRIREALGGSSRPRRESSKPLALIVIVPRRESELPPAEESVSHGGLNLLVIKPVPSKMRAGPVESATGYTVLLVPGRVGARGRRLHQRDARQHAPGSATAWMNSTGGTQAPSTRSATGSCLGVALGEQHAETTYDQVPCRNCSREVITPTTLFRGSRHHQPRRRVNSRVEGARRSSAPKGV